MRYMTQKQEAVYNILVARGPTKALLICKLMGMHSSNAYPFLNRMRDLGLIAKIPARDHLGFEWQAIPDPTITPLSPEEESEHG